MSAIYKTILGLILISILFASFTTAPSDTRAASYTAVQNGNCGGNPCFMITDTDTPTSTYTATLTPTESATSTPTGTVITSATTAENQALTAYVYCGIRGLVINILTGDGLFNITGTGLGLPIYNVAAQSPIYLWGGDPYTYDYWSNVTITEQTGDQQSINYGNFGCIRLTDTVTPSFTLTGSACTMDATAPALISPMHRAHTTDTTPTFSWSTVSGSKSYRVMVYLEDRSFEYKKRVFVTNYTLPSAEALTPSKYLWRVRTQDTTCSTWSTWSGRNTLFVD
jgi:hypothetical protein